MTLAEIVKRQRAILAAYVAGRSNRQIAAEFGVHRSYPTHLAKRLGVRLKRPPAPSAPWPKPYRNSG